MNEISYSDYLDKVYGCWLGKSVAGTIGSPFEGRKELFNYEYNPKSIENILPNDDLDLQVLWLEVLEQRGLHITSEDLARAFMEKCPYAPGEYAIFKKNYGKGIRPPYSGAFNNSYYIDGMGCPIRSEIWACISPGNPGLASRYAEKDGVLDHGSESVYAEQFLASLESAAFFEKDMRKLIDLGLSAVPKNSRFYALVSDILSWAGKGYHWRRMRSLVLMHYGHPDCTNMFQNMGIILLALLTGGGEFIETVMRALNCGYDTDCTCATTGAILGIINGAASLIDRYGFRDTRYVLGVHVKRRSDMLYDLAEDVCRIGIAAAMRQNQETRVTGVSDSVWIPPASDEKDIEFSVEYLGLPSVGVNSSASVRVLIKNNTVQTVSGRIYVELPEGWQAGEFNPDVTVEPCGMYEINMIFYLSPQIRLLYEKNLISLYLKDSDKVLASYAFGLSGAAIWTMYGPFADNILTLPNMDYWDSYAGCIRGRDENETMDLLRDYHVNSCADIHKEYLSEPGLRFCENTDSLPVEESGILFSTHTDRFVFDDLTTRQGPCAVYMERLLYSPEDLNVFVQVGFSDSCKLWINDELLFTNSFVRWCTNENRHFSGVKLHRGINRVVFKLVRNGHSAVYSLIFSAGITCAEHIYNFASEVGGKRE